MPIRNLFQRLCNTYGYAVKVSLVKGLAHKITVYSEGIHHVFEVKVHALF